MILIMTRLNQNHQTPRLGSGLPKDWERLRDIKIVIRKVIERMKRIPSRKLTTKLPEILGLEDDPFLLIFRLTNRCKLLVFGGGNFWCL